MFWESIRTKFFYKSLDAVMTARIRRHQSRWENLKGILGLGHSRYNRVSAAVGLLDSLLPGSARRASELLIRTHKLPFSSPSVELLGSGSGATVFLLPTAADRFVLKAYRRTIGQGSDALLELAKEFRWKYETVSSWYSDSHDIVARASFVILHSPLLGQPAVACVQRYVDAEKHDFFRDFNADELLGLMDQSGVLREQFVSFARATLRKYEADRLCPDLLGDENLLLVGTGHSVRLKLIDYGILEVAHLKKDARARLTARFLLLQSLLESTTNR